MVMVSCLLCYMARLGIIAAHMVGTHVRSKKGRV